MTRPFRWQPGGDCSCVHPTCRYPSFTCAGDPPPSFDVSISGFTDDICTECANLNGHYNLPHYSGGGDCNYLYDFADPVCFNFFRLFLSLGQANDKKIEVTLASISLGGSGIFYTWVDPTFFGDCLSISGLSIPFFERGPDDFCAGTGTCVISAGT